MERPDAAFLLYVSEGLNSVMERLANVRVLERLAVVFV